MATTFSAGLVDGGRYPMGTGTLYASRCNYEASLTYKQVIKPDGKYIQVVIKGDYSVSYKSLSGYTMKAPNQTTFYVQDVSANRYDSATHDIHNKTFTYEYKYDVLSALTFKYKIYCWCQCVPQYVGKEDSGYIECVPSTTIGVSAISASSADIGKATRITITKMDDSYIDNLYYTANGTKTLIAENVSSPYDWVLPTSLFSLLGSSARSIPIRLSVETFSGAVNLGTDVVDINGLAAEADCKPTLNPLLTILNPQATLTGNSTTGIVGFNKVNVKPQASARYNATITSITTKHNSITKSGEDVEFDLGNDTFTITVVDSRGFSASEVKSVPLVNWFKPTLTFEAETPDATTNACKIDASGSFFNSSFGVVDNTLSVQARWKTGSAEYSEWVDTTITITNNTYKATYTATLDYTKQWTIQVRAIDKLATILGKEIVVITLPVFDWSEADFNFNVPVSSSNTFTTTGNPYGFISHGTTGQDIGFYAEETDTKNRIAMEVWNGKVGLYMGHKGTWLISADGNNVYINNKLYHPISVGTAAPSGGSDGDIYFQLT